ncbi:MAG: tRNA (N6-isopentenyl adenosine(37)-C2)-methylthiotransferase MiaB, partial [Bacilli bacterium]|nr:tRNA (N6-isopentenyl adenosine(37)-C2)-methylthiotransferase MiaB [Bacilli bacterium]
MSKDYSKYFGPSLKDARKRLNKEVLKIDFEMTESLVGLGKNKKYLLKTYGCQGNLADSEKIAGILELLEFQPTKIETEADVILINTCAIRENAENRVFGEIGRLKSLKRHHPDLLLVLCGCMPQEERVVQIVMEKHPQV